MNDKSSVDEIRRRFDADVERFSNLETGQSATIDAALAMDLVARAAAIVTPSAKDLVDVGCGAGNYTLKLLERLPGLNVRLIDLSQPMLDRAEERVRAAGAGKLETIQGDVRDLSLGVETCDIIVAAAVLHHLRVDHEWRAVFGQFQAALRPGGSLWIFDLIGSDIPALGPLFRERYADYLVGLRDEKYRDEVFAYIEREDTPRPLVWQLDILREVGFAQFEALHRNACFAAFGAVKQ